MSSPYPNHGNSSYNGPPSTSAYPITSYSSLDDWDGSKSKDPSQTDDPASASTLATATPTASWSYQVHQSSSTDTQNAPPATDHHSIPPFMVHDGYPPSTTGVRTTYSGAHHFSGGSSHATASGVSMSTHDSAYGLAGGPGHAPVFLLPGDQLPQAHPNNVLLSRFVTRRSHDPDYVTWWDDPRPFCEKTPKVNPSQRSELEKYFRKHGRAPPIHERAQLAVNLGIDSACLYMWFSHRFARSG